MRALAANHRLHGRYRILGVLGRGGQSQVYLAADEGQGGATVVIKNMIYHSADEKVRREELELFLQEASILGEVQHPCLPRLVGSFAEGDAHFVVEERVGDLDVGGLLRRRGGTLALHEVAWLGSSLLDLLGHLHTIAPAVVLRDVKPSNITCCVDAGHRVRCDRRPWFIDLTIATRWRPGQTDAVRMGSPGYAPPEQYRGASEPRSDLYGLAATLFQALTGHDPVGSPFKFPAVHDYLPELPRGWDAFFKQALALDPDRRFANARQMRDALDRLIPPRAVLDAYRRHIAAAPEAPALPARPPRRPGRRAGTRPRPALSLPQAALALAGAILALLGLLAALGGLTGA